MLGGTSVIVTGPCFNESLEYTCQFDTGIFISTVRGVYLDERRLLCVSPMLTQSGNVGFRLQMHEEEGTEVTVPQSQEDPIPFYSCKYNKSNLHSKIPTETTNLLNLGIKFMQHNRM